MAFLKRRRIAKTAKPRRRPFKHESLEPRRLLAADPIITEFAATNSGFLLDGFGASPDWVEIHNRGDASVDLAGYSLTDEADELDKWQFPQVLLDPGEYLIVYASGLDTVDPAGHLHTNFGLSASGEYLALVSPSEAILSEFGSAQTDYPAQETNDSYGLPYDSTFTQVVTPESAVRYLVPSNGDVDATWASPAFDDTGWSSGLASLGNEAEPGLYADLIETTLPLGSRSAYVRIPFNVSDANAKLGTLNVRFDDGFVAYLNGSPIAEFNAPEAVDFDSRATELRPREAAIEPVGINVGDHSDLLVVGENILAIHLMDAEQSPTLSPPVAPDWLMITELTIAAGDLVGSPSAGLLMAPTPGQPNTQVRAQDVGFSRHSGVFSETFQLAMSAGAGEMIRYTLDGTTPDGNSQLYTVPIAVASTTQVRARAFGSAGQIGRAVTAAYTKITASEAAIESTLPIIVLENFGMGRPDREFQDAYLSLYDIDESTGRSSLGGTPDVTTLIGQHRRGSSTYGSAKYSLRIELRDENGGDLDLPLLGMPAESDWILYGAGFYDRSLIRNALAYDLSNQADNYAVKTRYVEVYNNTSGGPISEAEYFGVYVLMETIKIGEDRVDLEEISPADTSPLAASGGYIFKQDRYDSEEDSNWQTSRNQPIGPPTLVHVSPSRADLTQVQVDSLRNAVQEFEDALYGPNATDPELGYAAHIDTESWVEHHLFRMLFNDADSLYLSEHFTLDRDGKIQVGPVWDFNLSSGHNGAWVPNAWSTSNFNSGWWWGRLFNDPDFTQLWVDKWWSLREGALSEANLLSSIDSHVEEIRDATERNFDRWTQYPPTGVKRYASPESEGWDAEIEQLTGWLNARVLWIDQQMTPRTRVDVSGGVIIPGTMVTLSNQSPSAEIYFTLDGSDPRGDGGAVSPSAILYTGPIQIGSSVNLRTRSFDPALSNQDLGPWSAEASEQYTTEQPADASNLRISELHYNPLDPTSAELQALPGIDNNSFEFVELLNVSGRSIDLNDVRFTEGIAFDFSSSEEQLLGPGETILIVQNRDAFELRYGNALPIAGEYSGRLSGGGEDLELVDAQGAVIQAFEYDDESPWPEAADGDGPSLESIDPLGDPAQGSNWVASAVDGGTPGSATAPLLGDYDRSGLVDELDRSVWINLYGSTVAAPGVGPDGNRDGVVDAADYSVWRDQLGQTQIQLAMDKGSEANDSSEQSAVISSRAMPVGYWSNEYKPSVRPRPSGEQTHLDAALALEDDLLMLHGQDAAGAALPNASVGSAFEQSGDPTQSEQPEEVDAAFAALSEAPWGSFKGL